MEVGIGLFHHPSTYFLTHPWIVLNTSSPRILYPHINQRSHTLITNTLSPPTLAGFTISLRTFLSHLGYVLTLSFASSEGSFPSLPPLSTILTLLQHYHQSTCYFTYHPTYQPTHPPTYPPAPYPPPGTSPKHTISLRNSISPITSIVCSWSSSQNWGTCLPCPGCCWLVWWWWIFWERQPLIRGKTIEYPVITLLLTHLLIHLLTPFWHPVNTLIIHLLTPWSTHTNTTHHVMQMPIQPHQKKLPKHSIAVLPPQPRLPHLDWLPHPHHPARRGDRYGWFHPSLWCLRTPVRLFLHRYIVRHGSVDLQPCYPLFRTHFVQGVAIRRHYHSERSCGVFGESTSNEQGIRRATALPQNLLHAAITPTRRDA